MPRIIYVLLLLFPHYVYNQSIGINENQALPHSSAMLDVSSDSKGILIPRTDTALIQSPAEGLLIYQLQDQKFYYHRGSKWISMGEASVEFPTGTILLSESFPNESLEQLGFLPYGSYEQSFTDISPNNILYGEWTKTSNNAPSGLVAKRGWWTGKELILWGGNDSEISNVGAIYDPSIDTWISMSQTNAPLPRKDFAGVWTGTHLLIFGGKLENNDANDLFIYDPSSDTWTEISDPNPPSPRRIFRQVWTGEELMFWGGDTIVSNTSRNESDEGYIYSVANNTWTKMSTVGAPQAILDPGLTWADDRLVVIGGWIGTGYPSCSINSVEQKYYDPVSDTWNSLGRSYARKGDVGIHIGGYSYFSGGNKIRFDVDSGGPFGGGSCVFNGFQKLGLTGKYDPSNNSWPATGLTLFRQPLGQRDNTQFVAKGDTLIYWGFNDGQFAGQLITTSTDENWPMASLGSPPQYQYTSHWIGDRMLCFSVDQDIYFFDPSQKGENPYPTELTRTIYMYRKE